MEDIKISQGGIQAFPESKDNDKLLRFGNAEKVVEGFPPD